MKPKIQVSEDVLTEKVNVGKCKIRLVLNDGKILYLNFIGDKNLIQQYVKYCWCDKIHWVSDVYYISAVQYATRFISNLKENEVRVIENKMVKVKNIAEAEICGIEENWVDVTHEEYIPPEF